VSHSRQYSPFVRGFQSYFIASPKISLPGSFASERCPTSDWRRLSALDFLLLYSVRSAVIGFTRVARLAGKKQARSAALASINAAATSANGSLGLTS
jgi:hypothetical protein